MRVKQTAKKISSENDTEIPPLLSDEKETELKEHNSVEQEIELSDNEVEFVVECRRDQQGNQFLLDGTPVIEPAEVDTTNESKENLSGVKEINFIDFIKEMQAMKPIVASTIIPRKNSTSLGANINIYNTIKCTACNSKFNPFLAQSMFIHPLMEVILCKDCILNQKDEYFVIDKDDDKETLCRWCVEGGSLICCDVCPKSFCKACIKRNLGRATLTEILNQDETVQWKCFVCDPKPIEDLKTACKKVKDAVQIFIENQTNQKMTKKPISRLSEIVNKKRPLAKAFPNGINSSPNVSAPKISTPKIAMLKVTTPKVALPKLATPKTPVNKTVNSGVLLNNMANFGTEWYMRNVNLRNIFSEIDEINPQTLLNALNSTKKCVEAFYSDIRNLEGEISKASNASDITSVVSMFKSVYRHHIFNRFCQVKTRMEEDRKTNLGTQTLNGKTDYNTGITNTNSIPSLSINNVVSTAYIANSSFTTKSIVTPMKTANTNGEDKIDIMASIDLTDDADNKSDSLNGSIVDNYVTSKNKNEDHVENIFKEDKSEEVVDLCIDEDSITPSYPLVNLNLNNKLSFDRKNSD